jgi:hypothetical protein
MKTEERCDEFGASETDHDAAWRERIQRALRDLRSFSSGAEEPTSPRLRAR